MGSARPRPKRLAEKLLMIRNRLDGGLSQSEMALKLGLETEDRERVSKYERGVLEPPLLILLQYARISGSAMEMLVDDEMNLSGKFL